jgi:cytochrome c heme-lyase
MTPRARFNTLLGYTAPFDRHDWVIDRCGKKIEYVIDFYAGKQPSVSGATSQTGARGQGQAAPSLSFYLDVRPKLNSWEGWRMRIARAFGPR